MHFPQKYIDEAIKNPLLFQQNNPLISESMSLLNSRHKKQADDSRQLDQFSSKEISAKIKKKYNLKTKDEFQQSSNDQNQNDQDYHENQSDSQSNKIQNQRAIREFQREIQEKFKISVSNKIYTFPKLKITSIMDIISSSEDQDQNQQDLPSKSTSQLTEGQFNPFDPKLYHQKNKTQHLQSDLKSKGNLQKFHQDKNFKKVKISERKDKQKKNCSLKKQKEELQNYTNRQKAKNMKKNPQILILSKEKKKPKNQTQKVEKVSQKFNNTKIQKQLAVKQSKSHKFNLAERLKTEMDNGSSGISQSITESKRRFYEQEFCIRK